MATWFGWTPPQADLTGTTVTTLIGFPTPRSETSARKTATSAIPTRRRTKQPWLKRNTTSACGCLPFSSTSWPSRPSEAFLNDSMPSVLEPSGSKCAAQPLPCLNYITSYSHITRGLRHSREVTILYSPRLTQHHLSGPGRAICWCSGGPAEGCPHLRVF